MSQNKGYNVENKVALVTGSNRGIGKALVDQLFQSGAKKVYAAVRAPEKARPLVDAYDTRLHVLEMDLNKPDTIAQAASQARDVQIVINNAGILSHTNPLSPDAVENLQEEMQVNVYGMMHVAQHFAPILKRNGGGVFCQVNSVASLRCLLPSVSTYSASKAAAFTMTQALRAEMTETLVMSVHPGPIATDMIQGGDLAKLEPASPQVVAEEVIQAMERGDFLVFPDPKSKQLSQAYKGFSKYVFEDGNVY